MLRASDGPALPDPDWNPGSPDPATSSAPWRLFNIGNAQPVRLIDYIDALETALGRKAIRNLLPLQPGDVPDTYADVSEMSQATGYAPTTSVDDGIRHFVDWYRGYYRM